MSYNTNAPEGLKILGYSGGKDYDGAVSPYSITSGYATTIGENDPVAMLSDGSIGIGVAGAQCIGVFQYVTYFDANGVYQQKNKWTASTPIKAGTTITAYVADDPELLFTIQETDGSSGAGTPLALADRNININFVIGAPNANGVSTTSINNTTEATTSTLNLKILRLDSYPGNAVGSFANWVCKWNTHTLKSVGTAGV